MQKIFSKRVISLQGSKRIENFFKNQSTQDFEIFDAFDGSSPEREKFFNISGFMNLYNGAKPSAGQIGCAISHYLLLKEFCNSSASKNDLLLVAEDDAQPLPEFQSIINNILHKNKNIELLILASSGGYGGKRKSQSYSERYFQQSIFATNVGKSSFNYTYKLGNYSGIVWGAGLYLINKKSAQKYVNFVERCGGIHWLADDWKYFISPCEINLEVLRPPLADFYGPSEIRDNTSNEVGFDEYSSLKDRIALRTRIRQVIGRISATLDDFKNKTKFIPKD